MNIFRALSRKKDFPTNIAAILLITIFGYTSTNKLISHDRFQFQLQLIPISLIARNAFLVSVVVPLAEFGLAIALCLRRYRIPGLFGATALLGVFQIYLVALMVSYKDLPCACAGISFELSWTGHLILNALLIAVSIFALLKTPITNHKP
jgi:uncharacterized membrane protein YhaH (DUF805 family)